MSITFLDGGGKSVLLEGKKLSDSLRICNATDVTVRGCEIRLEQKPSDASAIAFYWIKGTALVEGCFIACNNQMADGVRIFKSPGATLRVKKTWIQDPGYGFKPGEIHGDIIHTQGDGPLDLLDVEDVCGLTSGQGIFTPYRGGGDGSGAKKIIMNRVSVGWSPRRPASTKDMTLLYFGNGRSGVDRASPEGVTLRDVYLDTTHSRGTSFRTRIMPNNDAGKPFGADSRIDGVVNLGWRDWVTPAQVGLNYKGSVITPPPVTIPVPGGQDDTVAMFSRREALAYVNVMEEAMKAAIAQAKRSFGLTK